MKNSLKEQTVLGVFWNGLGSVGGGVLSFIIVLILARLLTPQDFGVLEILIVFTTISNVLIDSGFSQALIRDNKATKEDFTSIFYFNVLIAFFMYIILFFLSPLLDDLFDLNILSFLAKFVFLTIIFNSLSIIQNVIYTRDMNFKHPALISVVSVSLAGIVTIIMAFQGYGVWALATNIVLSSLFKTILLWVYSTWRPSGFISLNILRKYFRFGGNLLVQGLYERFVGNIESLCIGKVYSPISLGYYSQARKLDSYITQTSLAVIQKVTYPALSKINDNVEKLKVAYRKIVSLSMFVIIPLMMFTIFNAKNFIKVLFGSKWIESADYLQLWGIGGIFTALYTIFINIFLVFGKSSNFLKLSVVRQTLKLLCLLVLFKYSLLIFLSLSVSITVFFSFIYIYFAGKLIKYSILEVFNDLVGIVLISSVSSLSSFYIGLFLNNIDSTFILFLLQLFCMIAFYLFFSYKFNQPVFSEVERVLKSFIR